MKSQHSTAQHSTAQHSTAQHSTAVSNLFVLLFQRFNSLFNLSSVPQLNSNLITNSHLLTVKLSNTNKKLLKSLVNPICLCFILLSALTVNIANAALTATTAKTIQGRKPYLKLSNGTALTSLDQLAGFSMPNGSGGTRQVNASMAGTAIAAPLGMKFSDVVALVTANGNTFNVSGVAIGDADGDASNAANTTASGTMKATWYDNNVKVTNLSKYLNIGGGPYKLVINVSNVSANTTYGIPNSNAYGSKNVTYTFTSTTPAITLIQPASMAVFLSGSSSLQRYSSTGYNSAVWASGSLNDATSIPYFYEQTGGGFKIKSGFPTTGFYKAKFSLIGVGSDQRVYRCTKAASENRISLSGTSSATLGLNCTVTYESTNKGSFTSGGTPTIYMEYNTGSQWVRVDSFTIPVPSKWAVVKTNGIAGTFQFNTNSYARGTYNAAIACGASAGLSGYANLSTANNYFYHRNELTNTPIADEVLPTSSTGGYFSRDVDGTFMGEWGSITRLYYPGAHWAMDYITSRNWTADTTVWSTTNMTGLGVNSNGSVMAIRLNSTSGVTICRGD